MIERRRHSFRAPRRAPGRGAGLGLAALLFLGACNSTAPASSASAPASVASVAPSASSSTPEASSPTPAVGQTDTDWGRIWDALPVGFPVYPGATPAEEAQSGPASATLVVQGVEAKMVVTWIQTELQRAGYATEALNGPLEDGGYVLDSVGAAGCRVEVAVAPLGGLLTLTVRYGSACPTP